MNTGNTHSPDQTKMLMYMHCTNTHSSQAEVLNIWLKLAALQGGREVTEMQIPLLAEWISMDQFLRSSDSARLLTCQGNDATEGQDWHEEDGKAQSLDS